MTTLNRKTRSLLGTAARQLWPHLNELSNNWKRSYRQIYPDDPEPVLRRLDKLNIGTLADCLKRGDLKACYETIGYHGRQLAKLGVPEKKLTASLRLYLQEARTLLRKLFPNEVDAERIVTALEQLQLVEILVARQSYSSLRDEGLDAIISVMDAQLSTEHLDEFLYQFLMLAIELVHAGSGRIVLLDGERAGAFQFQLDTARPRTRRERVDRALRRRIDEAIGKVLEKGEPAFEYQTESGLTLARREQTRAIWIFPIKVKARVLGVLLLRFIKYFECLPKEREVMEALLARAALAIERALLLAHIRANETRIRELTAHILVTQDEERRRISRELHDETSHSLLVLKLYLEMIYKDLPRALSKTRKQVKDARQLVEKTLKELRRLISDLGPAMLDDFGLEGAIRWYIKSMQDFFNMSVRLTLSKQLPRLTRNLEVAIYRTVQEALNNAARHSKATKVAVTIAAESRSIRINVKDNGIGFEPERLAELKRKRSFGLYGLNERVTLMGGSFTVESQPGQGTQVYVLLPMLDCSQSK